MSDPVFLITGASSGIGAATARAASGAGYRLVLAPGQGIGAARGFLNETVEHWRSMVLTNVYSAALTIRACLPAMREAREHFLLTGSVAGRLALPGSLYSATKWAVTAMGESLRQEVSGSGMRVTLIEPGSVDRPFFDSPGEGRLVADDIARTVMFAVSQPPHVDVNEILIRPTRQ
jgi:NADP-dependent 3-hydroxy acid dehydrogenase YdfG